jgi:prepilin-type N-terminal cleavage/methylation domain-containing protein
MITHALNVRRRAFTLYELLAALAILSLLLGLMLPAVGKARLAAARSQSANNLKQIGLAAHNYYSVLNAFPPGCDDNNLSAAAYLLPYIEQDNLYKTMDFSKSIDAKENEAARKTVVKTFLNPMDRIQSVSMDYGPTNYLFNAGSKPDLIDNDGLFYKNSKIRFPDITDGTSNTLLAGETLKGDSSVRATDVKRQYVAFKKEALKDLKDDSGVKEFKDDKMIAADRCASWMDGRFLQGTFTGTRVHNDEKPDVNCEGAGGLSGLRSLTDVVNVGMADGSVRAVSKSLKLEVWRALATRAGGEVIPNDF